jgi:poly(hydroxyalkanoate) depolymerase family esterase
MNARQMAAMAEATRLTRQGRLAEATALIQQTLASPALTRRPPDAPSAGDETGGTPGRDSAPPPAPRGGEGTPPGQVHPGWVTRRRALPSRGASGLRRPHRPAAPATKRPAGRFDAFSYANAAGTRAYRLYVPASHTGGPLPLVVMLHGGTQDAATFAAATGMNDLAEREAFLVAYPEQPPSANPGRYWNWFAPGHQRRDAGEPSLIAGITRQVTDRYEADATRVSVAGFSAGGAMAAVMAAVYPDLFAAAGVHSGLPYAAAGDVASAFAAMKQGPSRPARLPARPVPLIVFHGDQDATVAPANAAGLIEGALAAASPDRRPGTPPTAVTTGQVPGGHAYTRACYQDPAGAALAERWTIHQGGHAWSGGVPHGPYTDARGPDASAEFIRFFDQHPAVPLTATGPDRTTTLRVGA